MIEPGTPLPWSLSDYGRIIENAKGDALVMDRGMTEANAVYIVEACNAYPHLVAALLKLVKVAEQVRTQTSTLFVNEYAEEIEAPGCWWCGGNGCREDCPAKSAIAEAERLLRKEGE